jgi:DNA-binding MarR family transcriptional regulator
MVVSGDISWPSSLADGDFEAWEQQARRGPTTSPVPRQPRHATEPQAGKEELLALARAVLAGRRTRAHMLEGVDLGEPAWDILLDLFISTEERRAVSISGVCALCPVPPTTALRQIGLLVDAGYLQRIPDEEDRRRVFLRLSDEARRRMADCLRRMLPAMRASFVG